MCAATRGTRVLHSIAGIMRALRRIIVVASACLLGAGAPALAQVAPSNTTNTSAPAQNGVVGNPQLQGFSLNGAATRTTPAPPAEPPARTTNTQPSARVPGTEPASRGTPALTSRRSDTPLRDQAQGPEPHSTQTLPTLPEPTPNSDVQPTPAPSAEAPVDTTINDAQSPARSSPLFILPWIVAALALGGAAAWLFLRRRERPSLAEVGEMLDLAPSAPAEPQPKAAPPQAEPEPRAPGATISSGIVSTRLRPWLEIEFKPDRGVVDDQKAAIAFELSVYNSGSMPARDVLLEASLFNAGPMQDQQIQLFFDNPVARGDKIPVIPPMQRVTVNTAVFLAKDQVVPIEMEGRSLFVPMVAFNALYAWGSGRGQTSASFLVGKETTGDKLAPFRLDLGPRIFRGLAARAHSLAVRK